MQPKSRKDIALIVLVASLPILTTFAWWQLRPFKSTLSESTVSLQTLSRPQRHNVAIATQRLNQVVLNPGQVFSFNRQVGPRTTRRGYEDAPTYIGDSSANTIGGGICLVSSTLYQLALQSDLEILERHPHMRPIKTVKPGYDAAVWYGQSDLRFRNSSPQPLRLAAQVDDQQLKLSFQGNQVLPRTELSRKAHQGQRFLFVEVLRNNRKISNDRYSL